MDKSTYRMKTGFVEPETADAKQLGLLNKAQQDFQMIPNMYKAMVNLPAILEMYRFGYDHFRSDGGFTPAEQETVFLTISVENECNYCRISHGMYAEMFMQVPKEVVRSIIHKTEIPEGKLKSLSEFTSIMVNKRGNPTQQDVDAFLKAGYTERHILGIILAIATKTLSNYTNHLFGTEPDDMAKSWEY